MSNKETKTAEAVEVVQKTDDKKKKRKLLLLLLLLLLLICIGIGFCAKSTVSAGELERRLKADGTDTIELNGDVKVKEELVVSGEKTLTGNGRIVLAEKLDGEWPEGKGKTNSWGMGCTTLEAEDTSGMTALLTVSDGATLTVKGSTKVDAGKKANAIHVENGGELVVDGKAAVKNGRYANIVVNEKATAEIAGGKVQDAQSYGVINNGTLEISGGTLSGAEAGAVVYTTGTATQSGGTIEKAGVHNVYVAEGEFTMTGGKNDSASKDGVLVQDGAKAEIEDGDITNCVHGLCNSGEMTAGAITLKECGIMNYKTGVLTLNKTTVDTAAVYCLSNNGGKVTANKFTAKKCDTCAVYNFSGDMELTDLTISGSRDGNIANGGGNMTVNGAMLENCRDKSIVIANGKAVFNDVTLAGTSREKYGVYVYGGELYMTNGTVYDISSTAFKVDTGGYVEVKDVSMKDVAQIGFRADGGKIVAENVTMENLGSHAIYNMEGDITITKATINEVAKNMLQQKGGTTVLNELAADKIDNHGAYIDLGKVTITESTIKNMQGNGIYLTKNDNEAIVKNVVLDGVQKQGVNNASKLTIDGLTVRNAVQNGIFNKETGTITAEKVVISDVNEHGINNYNTMTLKDAEISNTGKGSNGLQNKGTLTIEEVSVKNSKNHGVYNTGTIKGSALEIKNVAQNGVYNNDGTFNVTEVTVNGAGEHGLNNGASMTVADVTVKDTGKGKNSVQNSGTLSISKATLTGSKNHGIYNTGTISGKDVTVEGAAENGVYNAKGKIDAIDGLVINKAGSHGINNDAAMTVSNVTVKNTGAEKNSIQNAGTLTVTTATLTGSKNHGVYNTGTISGKDVTVNDAAKNGIYNAKGTVTVAGLTVDGVGEHGINNDATIKVSDVAISNTGKDKNGIQNAGTATVTTATIKNSKNHGIYNTGKLSGKNITVEGPAGNGVYNNEGTVNAIAGLTVKKSGDQGVNNKGTFVASNVKIDGTAKNGIYNNKGTATVNGLTISNTGEHGVSNEGTMTASSIDISDTGAGKNGIQNKGTLTTNGVAIDSSKNHGFYNAGTVTAKGNVEITNSEVNAVYNYQGEFKAEKVVADVTGEHGINNAATLEIGTVKVTSAGQNSIQNSGDMTVSESAVLNDSGKHGIYNGDTFHGENISITNAGDLALSNGGEMEVYGLETAGTAHKAIYNNGYAELYTATIDGTSVANSGAEYLIDNNGGVLDLTDATIKNAKGTALHNRGKAATSVTNVVINTAGNYGTFVESGSSLSGDGLEINNITKGISGAEGMPIKNAGKITMLDHVTIGADDPEVTGSAAEVNTTLGNIVNNAIVNDAATARYSGYDLVVNNATAGCAIYNKGIVYVTDFAADKPKDGIVSRYDGWATLSGNIVLTNTSRNPMVTYGPESKSYTNGIELTSGSTMTIDGAASHAINNKGSFLAAADTDIKVKNITGTNVNGINNQSGGTMELGNVSIDNMHVAISVNSSTNKINTNSGTALMVGAPLTLNGKLEISNIYTKPANGATDNTNGGGVVVKNSGSINGTGSIVVNGNGADGNYMGLQQGIFSSGRPINITGNVSVNNTNQQGLYIADGASLKAADITVDTTAQNGIYVRKDNSSVIALGKVTVKNAASGKQGINIADGTSKLEAKNVEVTTVGGNGIVVGAADYTKGSLTVTETIKVTSPTNGRGINNYGTVKVGNIEISGITGYAGIENNNKIEATGNVTIQNITDGPGIRNKGTMTVNGTTTIQNISGAKTNGIQQDGGKTLNLNNLTISNVSSTTAGSNYGNGIYTKGTINLSGTANISNIKHETATLDTEGCGIVNAEAGRTIQGTGSIIISDVQRLGINNLGTIKVASVSVTKAGTKGILNTGIIGGEGTGTVTVDMQKTGTHGIHNSAGTIKVAGVTVQNTNDVGIFMENEAVLEATTVNVNKTSGQAIQLNYKNKLTVDTMTITESAKNGLRLYNNNSDVVTYPTVTVGTLITRDCTEYGLAASKSITTDYLNVTLLQYYNCGSTKEGKIVHDNAQTCVGTLEALPQ